MELLQKTSMVEKIPSPVQNKLTRAVSRANFIPVNQYEQPKKYPQKAKKLNCWD